MRKLKLGEIKYPTQESRSEPKKSEYRAERLYHYK